MIAFIVPLMSRTVSSDWNFLSFLVNRCISSICNQKHANFKVIIACHEIPDTSFTDDSRVEFLVVNFHPPKLEKNSSNRWVKEADKGKKIIKAAERAKEIGATYVMTVDADDCISNKISSYVNANTDPEISGWFVQKGYLYPEGKTYSYLNLKNFNTLCGSCVIIKPELIDYMFEDDNWFNHEIINLGNENPLLPLPFPGALYSMLNGSNIVLNNKELRKRSKINFFSKDSIITLIRRLKKYRIVPIYLIKKEFSIYYI